MWEGLSSRDKTITTLDQLLYVAGKPLPRKIDVKSITLNPLKKNGDISIYSD
jgi:hypothetical protein